MTPFPDPTNVSTFSGLLSYTDVITEGYFGALILFTIFIVAFLALKGYSAHKALAASSFLCMILAIIFFIINLISTQVLIVSIVIFIASIIWLWIADKQDA